MRRPMPRHPAAPTAAPRAPRPRRAARAPAGCRRAGRGRRARPGRGVVWGQAAAGARVRRSPASPPTAARRELRAKARRGRSRAAGRRRRAASMPSGRLRRRTRARRTARNRYTPRAATSPAGTPAPAPPRVAAVPTGPRPGRNRRRRPRRWDRGSGPGDRSCLLLAGVGACSAYICNGGIYKAGPLFPVWLGEEVAGATEPIRQVGANGVGRTIQKPCILRAVIGIYTGFGE